MAQQRIMVVDDALMVRRHVSHILIPAGLDVDEASNGMEAIEAMKRTAYALVLLDLEMPKMSGVDVLRILRSGAIKPAPPVLVLTSAEVEPADLQKLRELGAIGFLDKAAAPDQLLFRVRAALAPAPAGATDRPSGSTA